MTALLTNITGTFDRHCCSNGLDLNYNTGEILAMPHSFNSLAQEDVTQMGTSSFFTIFISGQKQQQVSHDNTNKNILFC